MLQGNSFTLKIPIPFQNVQNYGHPGHKLGFKYFIQWIERQARWPIPNFWILKVHRNLVVIGLDGSSRIWVFFNPLYIKGSMSPAPWPAHFQKWLMSISSASFFSAHSPSELSWRHVLGAGDTVIAPWMHGIESIWALIVSASLVHNSPLSYRIRDWRHGSALDTRNRVNMNANR